MFSHFSIGNGQPREPARASCIGTLFPYFTAVLLDVLGMLSLFWWQITLHWLRLAQRVYFKVAVMAFRVLHGLAPPYLNDLVRVADLPGRRRLRSSSSHQLLVPPFRLTTVGRRTFPVAASLLCNSLPSDIQSSPSLPVFRQRLKTFLFHQSFANIVLWLYCAFMDFVAVCYSSHVKTISLTLTLTLLTGCSIQQTATTAGAVRVLVVSRTDQRQCMNRPAVAAAR